ncbi:acyltransferase family protein [Paraburkholderia ferrariae]|uniref:acyltransferase family protein n=1 Tax=Paraburkholderia ferrariae TaxID=386056 RepID=UPI0005A71B36|nr:acyltransferase [Paraburkholderia ferrariae]
MHEKYNKEIQVIRAAAILAVFVRHLPILYPWNHAIWENAGRGLWVGVDLFFCISGYVIAKSLLPRLEGKLGLEFWYETWAFWLRRIYRIVPSAWLWALIGVLVLTAAGQHGFREQNLADLTSIVLNVANLHFYQCFRGAANCGSFEYYWTLSLEEQFYLLLPLAILILGRRLTVAFAALVLLQIFLYRPQLGNLLAFIKTDAIMLGVLIAQFSRTQYHRVLAQQFNRAGISRLLPVLLLASLFACTRFEIVSFYTGLAAAISAAAICLASFERGYFLPPSIFAPILVWIGERSFAIYLIHPLIFYVLNDLCIRVMPEGTHLDSTWTLRYTIAAVALTAILAEFNYRFVENPLRRKGRKLASRMTIATSGG